MATLKKWIQGFKKRIFFIWLRVNKNNGFDKGNLSFDLFIEPQEGDISWVENTVVDARKMIDGPTPQLNQVALIASSLEFKNLIAPRSAIPIITPTQ